MSDAEGRDDKPRVGTTRTSSRLELRAKTVEAGVVRQTFPHGRSRQVAVEVKRRRTRPGARRPAEPQPAPKPAADKPAAEAKPATEGASTRSPAVLKTLTEEERRARLRALAEAKKREEEERRRAEEEARRRAEEEERRRREEEEARRRREEEERRRREEEEARRRAEEMARRLLEEEQKKAAAAEAAETTPQPAAPQPGAGVRAPAAPAGMKPAKVEVRPETLKKLALEEQEEETKRKKGKEKRPSLRKGEVKEKKPLKLVVSEELEEAEEVEAPPRPTPPPRRERRKKKQAPAQPTRVVREVQIPDEITVRELAERMAVRAGEVVKTLMKLGVMANINQTIDADTAELVVTELGHIPKRVSEAAVEEGLEGPPDPEEALRPRPPVVTVMGHVDHGKTSLLDALRQTDVAAREAGGITQHIGAYRVDIGRGLPVTFIDTPGHEAFTEMRARGAQVTDIVVLVVAADDGVMPQTVEAIRHAQAAKVPIIVAINKIDKPDADPQRVKNELLNYGVVVEEFGGEVLAVEVSAKERIGLEELIEAIQLQAELLDLKANPDRRALGTILEAKLEKGRGPVATVLVQNGTLRVGDVVVAGCHWGRVRAMMDDRGQRVKQAGPAVPVEILGLDGVPEPGDRLVAVESEERAREVAEYRQRKRREEEQRRRAGRPAGTLEDLFARLKAGETRELPILLKADVHGSLEAIRGGIEKLATEEVRPVVIHAGVGAISESDIHLAKASQALIIGFNVRAPAAVRELAKREGVEIRYYAVIYQLLDDVKQMLKGLLAPEARETVLGHAEVRQVFNVPKVGRVAGCMVTDGVVRRNARVRVVRDGVVIHDGTLASLRRFKEDVREVREGYECGIGLEGFQDIREGDVLEIYEVQEVARSLAS